MSLLTFVNFIPKHKPIYLTQTKFLQVPPPCCMITSRWRGTISGKFVFQALLGKRSPRQANIPISWPPFAQIRWSRKYFFLQESRMYKETALLTSIWWRAALLRSDRVRRKSWLQEFWKTRIIYNCPMESNNGRRVDAVCVFVRGGRKWQATGLLASALMSSDSLPPNILSDILYVGIAPKKGRSVYGQLSHSCIISLTRLNQQPSMISLKEQL